MNDISVGDFAEQLVKQSGEKNSPASPTLQGAVSTRSSLIFESSPDVSEVQIPTNFLEAIVENKDYVEPPPPVEEEPLINEDKAQLAEENPIAGQAIDIIIEGLGKMLEAVKGTLNEVKEFVNEHSLVNEITGSGSLGVNMAPSKKKKRDDTEEACEYDEEEKRDKVKRILNQFKNKKQKK